MSGEQEIIAARLRTWSAGQGPTGPHTLEIYPTLRCNLRCRFCDTSLRRDPSAAELPRERLLEMIREAGELGVRRLFVLGGGEPLVSEATVPAMALAKELGMEGLLSTNGSLLNGPLARRLVEWGWDEVQLSIDGASARIHDELRGSPGAFKAVMTAGCRIKAARSRARAALPRLVIHFVLTRVNAGELVSMVKLAHLLGACRVDFDALVAYLPEQRSLMPREEDLELVMSEAKAGQALADELGIQTTLRSFLDPRTFRRGEPDAGPPGTTLGAAADMLGEMRRAPCLRPFYYLVVQADGRISPCCVLAGVGGSVAETTLRDAWEHDPWLQEARRTMLAGCTLPRCRECSANILSHEDLLRSLL